VAETWEINPTPQGGDTEEEWHINPPGTRGAALQTGSFSEFLKNTAADIAGVAVPGATFGLLRAGDLPIVGNKIEEYRTPEEEKSTTRKVGEFGLEMAAGVPLAGPIGKAGAIGMRAAFPELAAAARPAAQAAVAGRGLIAGTEALAPGATTAVSDVLRRTAMREAMPAIKGAELTPGLFQEAAAPITSEAVAAARKLALGEDIFTGVALGAGQTAGDVLRGEATWLSALEKMGLGAGIGVLAGLVKSHGVGKALVGARAAADRAGFELTIAEQEVLRERLSKFALTAESESTIAGRQATQGLAQETLGAINRPQPGAGEGIFGPQGIVPERPPGEAALGVERPAGRAIPLGPGEAPPSTVPVTPPFSPPRPGFKPMGERPLSVTGELAQLEAGRGAPSIKLPDKIAPPPPPYAAPHLSDQTFASLVERGVPGGTMEIGGAARRATEFMRTGLPEWSAAPGMVPNAALAFKHALEESGWKRMGAQGAQAEVWMNERVPGTVFKWTAPGGKKLAFHAETELGRIARAEAAGADVLKPGEIVTTESLRALGLEAPEGLEGFTTRFAGTVVDLNEIGPGDFAALVPSIRKIGKLGFLNDDWQPGNNVMFFKEDGKIVGRITDLGMVREMGQKNIDAVLLSNANEFVKNYTYELSDRGIPLPPREELNALGTALVRGGNKETLKDISKRFAKSFLKEKPEPELIVPKEPRLKAPGCGVSLPD
jgi:hypothetical protein